MTDEERELDAFGARLAHPLRGPERLPSDFEARLAARMRAETQATRVRTHPAWTRRLRPILLAAGFVLAAALGATMERWRAGDTPPEPVVSQAAADTVRLVQFVLVAPDARSVALVGDFNGWSEQATPLAVVGGGGVWSVSLPLGAGRYQYAFVVDGARWVLDPAAPRAVEESFGPPNSVITVGERS